MIGRRTFIKMGTLVSAGIPFFGPGLNAPLLPFKEFEKGNVLDQLKENFKNPPQNCHSSCYWWWFNGLVDKEGITRDLEEFKLKGIGEVLLVNTAGGLGGIPFPQGAQFLSEDWKELYRHAMKEAKRLSIPVGINLSSGWCMGGPWIKPDNSGRWYLQSEMEVEGPQQFYGKLPMPGNRVGYDKVFNPPGYKEYIDLPLDKLDYRDTAIVAIRNNGTNNRLKDEREELLTAKTNRKDASNFILAVDVMDPVRKEWVQKESDMPIALKDVIVLTSAFSKDGYLNWNVPEGKWKIIRTGHRMTGSRLMIAQPEADGLSIDWFDKAGLSIQFEQLGKMFIDEAAKVGNKPHYFCDDSFEDGFPNWTEKIVEYFKKYRKYDPTPFFPVLSGYIIGNAAIADRFLNDYRKTIADCMADEHYGYFATLCHQHGISVQNEAAGPSRSGTICMDGLKNLGRSDYPMGEFWLSPKHDDETNLTPDKPYGVSRLDKGQNKVTKMVAAAAHLYGKKIASAEAFTSYRHWLDYPASLKQALDRAFCEGINRIVIHTSTATRPKDGKPGYEYGAGTHFNPNVTWWSKAGPFLDYVARCQYLLRAGVFVADALFYNGDTAPNLVEQKQVYPTLGKGYDYDVCNEEVLLKLISIKNGKLVTAEGMEYHILVLPEVSSMSLAVAEKLVDLVKKGATIIGKKPDRPSGLTGYPESDTNFKAAVDTLWGRVDGVTIKKHSLGNGTIIFGMTARDVLLQKKIKPDFLYTDNNGQWIDFIHRSILGTEVYFITNRHGQQATTTCSFRQKNSVPQLWDPVSGNTDQGVAYKVNGDYVDISLSFDVFQSWFVVFEKKSKAINIPASNIKTFLPVLELLHDWEVSFDPKWGGPSKVTFSRLEDWSQHADSRIRYYSGAANYEKTFDLENLDRKKKYCVELGDVKNIAHVWLNDIDLGVVWTAPWRVDISKALRKSNNKFRIEVINLWPNRLIGDAALPKEKRVTNTNIAFKDTDALLPSGLLGSVTIVTEK